MADKLGKIIGLDRYISEADDDRGGFGALNAAFGNSAEKFAAGRELDENFQIKANWKDRLFGHSTDELTEEYYKSKARQLRNRADVSALRAEGKDIDVNTLDAQIIKQSNDLNKLNRLRDTAAAGGYTELAELDDPRLIAAGMVKEKKAEVKQKEAEAETKYQNRLRQSQIREDGLTTRANLRIDKNAAEERAIRSQERTADLELRRDNMNMQYAQMARKDRMDAKDRKDKNIMMLMAGLQNLTQGFVGNNFTV